MITQRLALQKVRTALKSIAAKFFENRVWFESSNEYASAV
jgi:hypothetical protein